MTHADRLAEFVARAAYEDLSESAMRTLKIRVLDSLGCAIGALGAEPVRMIREHIEEFGGSQLATLIGGRKSAPDRAALYNGALVRYLDYNDSYLAPRETCHPSDNLGAVLATAEYAGGTGKDLLTAMAVAYQVQCRLSEVAPVRATGFDHTTQGAYAAAAGSARALGLDAERAANAVAISGTSNNALRVTRTGPLSHWKGLAYANTGAAATHAAFLAGRGITGPPEVFEGNKGFMDAISGPFEIDWAQEDLEAVTRTVIKKYNAEIHSQSALEGILELRERNGIDPVEVSSVELETFDVAHDIIGGGEEGEKKTVRTKEEADHSLPYMLAVALLDGEVYPAQYEPERIASSDEQSLLQKEEVRSADDLSLRFPEEMPARLRVLTGDDGEFTIEKRDYEGFLTHPLSWERALEKFERLASPSAEESLIESIAEAVRHLDAIEVRELTGLLGRVNRK
ncbi:MAG: MmgE/PrpD family protein [Rubrobacter sp.]|nr:MmgE/PrpD family protein [Rubrobacter sp.]